MAENMKSIKSEELNINEYNMGIEHKLKTFRLRTKAPMYAKDMKPEHFSKLPHYEWSKSIWVDDNDNECKWDFNKVAEGSIFKKKVDYFPYIDQWLNRHNKVLQKINCGVPCGKINDIVVVDLDFYKDGDEGTINQFNETFGTDYNVFNTYTVSTGSGGHHLYFKYDPEIKQTTNAETSVDIRNDGGYVVSAGTHFTTSSGKEKVYTVQNDTTIKVIPDNLKKWLMDNLYKGTKKKTKEKRNPVIKVTNPITLEVEEKEQDDIDLGVYLYDLSDAEIEDIFCKKIPDNYFNNYSDWLIFTTAMKTLGKVDLWDEYSKKRGGDNYDYDKNNQTYDDITQHNQLFCVEHLAKVSTARGSSAVLSYTKYKPTECHMEKATININRNKLGIRDDVQIDFVDEFIQDTRCLVVRSDTGTGKTTAMKKYINNKKCKVISIVSRISLGKEQNKVFQSSGMDIDYWENIQEKMDQHNQQVADYYGEFSQWSENEGDNIVITIDSLMKLVDFQDFHGYTIYLDEFNSLVEYFITCGNMMNKRIGIYKLFRKILLQCHKIVCSDADISDNSLLLLKNWGIDYKYINNEYKHNNNIKATELYKFNNDKNDNDMKTLIGKMRNTPKWMCCADSKTMVEIIAKLNDDTIKCYTSENGQEDIDLDAHDKVIFSPKIVYGLDSVMERPVFCYYKCHTITPAAMVQQICRNRNITELFYHFCDDAKKNKSYKYHNIDECILDITGRDKYGCKAFKILDDDAAEEYVNLLAGFLYNYDCYDTNKFAHFINIIRSRGFITDRKFEKTDDGNIAKELIELTEEKQSYMEECSKRYTDAWTEKHISDEWVEELENDIADLELQLALPFNEDAESRYEDLQYTIKDLKNHTTETYDERDAKMAQECGITENLVKTNEIFKIPFSKIGDFGPLFYNPKAMDAHLGACAMFFHTTGDVMEEIMKLDDFNANKSTSVKAQVLLCRKYKTLIGLCDNFTNTPLDEDGFIDETIIKPLDKKQLEIFAKEYNTVFRNRSKEFDDLTDQHTCLCFYAKMINHICGGGVSSVKTTKNKKHHIKYQYDKEKIKTTLELLQCRKKVNDYLYEFKVKDFLEPTEKYTPTMKAFKKPLTSVQKQQNVDKMYIDWMKQFKSSAKLLL